VAPLPGFVAAGLCAVALLRFARRPPPEALRAALLAVLGVLLALGTHTPFYRMLYAVFPPAMAAIREPARGMVLGFLGIGLLAGLALAGTRRAGGSPRTWERLAAVAAIAGLAEFCTAPILYHRADPEPSALSVWLRAAPVRGAVLELPLKTQDNIEYVYRSTEHDVALVNGYSGFFPRDFIELTRALERAESFSSVAELLRRRRAEILVFDARRATAAETRHDAGLLRSGVADGSLVPVALLRSRREKCLVFLVSGAVEGARPREFARPERLRVAAASVGAYLENPDPPKPLPDSWAFPWPEF
jgi:hypothetical protein